MTNTTASRSTTADPPENVLLSGRAVAQLVELLDHCYEYFLDDDRSLNQLREYCQSQRSSVTALWVVDQLSWHALLLRLQLTATGEVATHSESGE